MINVAVEGLSDVEAARAVIFASGKTPGKIYPAGGKTRLDPRIPSYAQAAIRAPWVVFRDSDGECPVEVHGRLTASLNAPTNMFQLRIACSMTEAWLMADIESFSDYFSVARSRLSSTPDDLPHAKQTLLSICARSRSRDVRRGVTAANGQIGPLYTTILNDFARDHWNAQTAAERSPSLLRAIARIGDMG